MHTITNVKYFLDMCKAFDQCLPCVNMDTNIGSLSKQTVNFSANNTAEGQASTGDYKLLVTMTIQHGALRAKNDIKKPL